MLNQNILNIINYLEKIKKLNLNFVNIINILIDLLKTHHITEFLRRYDLFIIDFKKKTIDLTS